MTEELIERQPYEKRAYIRATLEEELKRLRRKRDKDPDHVQRWTQQIDDCAAALDYVENLELQGGEEVERLTAVLKKIAGLETLDKEFPLRAAPPSNLLREVKRLATEAVGE